jgi:hypothetical protein
MKRDRKERKLNKKVEKNEKNENRTKRSKRSKIEQKGRKEQKSNKKDKKVEIFIQEFQLKFKDRTENNNRSILQMNRAAVKIIIGYFYGVIFPHLYVVTQV